MNLFRLINVSIMSAAIAISSPHTIGASEVDNQVSSAGPEYLAFVGTYTGGQSRGIHRFRFSPANGEATPMVLAAETAHPTFLAIHPNGRFLYAVNEIGNFRGGKSGAVSAFAVNRRNGTLTFLNQVSSVGSGPCHLVVDGTGKHVLLANYGGGSVAVLPIGEDGRLGDATAFVQHRGSGVDPRRQEAPHAHSINLDKTGRFAFVADLGLDKVMIYRFDAAKGTLTENQPPYAALKAGAGPRHFTFNPEGRFAYVINELDSTVTAFAYDEVSGALRELQTVSTLPEGFAGENTTAEVVVHPSGRFLYGSNRGHDSIATFTIDASKGTLASIGHESTGGKTPRNFVIDPSGKYLLAENQGSNSIIIFSIDQASGRLSPTRRKLSVGSPVCIRFLKAE